MLICIDIEGIKEGKLTQVELMSGMAQATLIPEPVLNTHPMGCSYELYNKYGTVVVPESQQAIGPNA